MAQDLGPVINAFCNDLRTIKRLQQQPLSAQFCKEKQLIVKNRDLSQLFA